MSWLGQMGVEGSQRLCGHNFPVSSFFVDTIKPLQSVLPAGAVELRNSLQQALGLQLPGTLVFDYPSAAAVAALCHQQLVEAAAAAADQAGGSAAAAGAGPSLEDMLGAVAGAVQAVAGIGDLAPETPLIAAGLDSLAAVELRNELQKALGVTLPGILIFDYPTPASLAAFLQQQLAAAAAAEATSGVASLALPAAGDSALAVADRQRLFVTVDATASRLSAPSISITEDSCRLTPFSRWDADGSAKHVPHRPGSRFARQVVLAMRLYLALGLQESQRRLPGRKEVPTKLTYHTHLPPDLLQVPGWCGGV